MPVRILVTEGTRADCKEAIRLIEGISAEALLADRGYDTNEIVAYAQDAGMDVVIPSKKNRKHIERLHVGKAFTVLFNNSSPAILKLITGKFKEEQAYLQPDRHRVCPRPLCGQGGT